MDEQQMDTRTLLELLDGMVTDPDMADTERRLQQVQQKVNEFIKTVQHPDTRASRLKTGNPSWLMKIGTVAGILSGVLGGTASGIQIYDRTTQQPTNDRADTGSETLSEIKGLLELIRENEKLRAQIQSAPPQHHPADPVYAGSFSPGHDESKPETAGILTQLEAAIETGELAYLSATDIDSALLSECHATPPVPTATECSADAHDQDSDDMDYIAMSLVFRRLLVDHPEVLRQMMIDHPEIIQVARKWRRSAGDPPVRPGS